MKTNKGLTLIALVITIIVLLILSGVSLSLTLGENGVINKASTVESTFNQSEVLEELKNLTASKYLEVYNETLGIDLSSKYNTDILLSYFAEDGRKVINSSNKNDSSNAIEEGYIYYPINLESLKRDISKYGKGNWSSGDVYAIRREFNSDAEGNEVYGAELEAVYKDFDANGGEITIIGSIDVNSPVN